MSGRFMYDRCPWEDNPDIPDVIPEKDRASYAQDPCMGCPSWGYECGAIWTLDGRELTREERDAEHTRRARRAGVLE